MRKITRKNLTFTVFLGSFILLGALARVWGLSSSPLWTDEISTGWIASAPTFGEAFHRAAETQGQTPFYYLLEWLVMRLLPSASWSLRLVSLLASVFSIYLTYRVCVVLFEWDGRWRKGAPYWGALTAAFFFAWHEPRIYYAQEARPYALGMMFALLSQLFFLKTFLFSHWKEDSERLDFKKASKVVIPYALFTAAAFYCHYVLATIVLIQNLSFLWWLSDDRILYHRETGMKWLFANCMALIFVIPSFFHLFPVAMNGGKWNWAYLGGVADTAECLMVSLSFWLVVAVVVLALIFHVVDGRLKAASSVDGNDAPGPVLGDKGRRGVLFFIVAWLLVPPVAAYAVTRLTTTVSFILPRYMTFAAPGFFILVAFSVVHLKNVWLERILAVLVCVACLALSSWPVYKERRVFAKRIPHNWRAAVEYVAAHSKPTDAVLIRFGVIKENWIPGGASDNIIQYCEAPLSLFAAGAVAELEVHPLTYSYYGCFYRYYDDLVKACGDNPRIWIIGVDPPNTNYAIGAVARIFPSSKRRMKFQKSFGGVYLCLLVKRPKPTPGVPSLLAFDISGERK